MLEVLDLYDKNLNVPEDVTLIWANDNFGHVRRYPNETELKRKGGHGLYYHASYWACANASYKSASFVPSCSSIASKAMLRTGRNS